jgi:hypothetical protein
MDRFFSSRFIFSFRLGYELMTCLLTDLSLHCNLFQCFSLFYIGLKLIAFNDCVEASEALTKVGCLAVPDRMYINVIFALSVMLQEIQEARKFLSEKGFKFQNA